MRTRPTLVGRSHQRRPRHAMLADGPSHGAHDVGRRHAAAMLDDGRAHGALDVGRRHASALPHDIDGRSHAAATTDDFARRSAVLTHDVARSVRTTARMEVLR